MHNPNQISRTQVSSAASPRYDFAAKQICRKMLQSVSFCFLRRKTDWIQWIPCLHLLVWYYAETRKKSSLDHFCKLFLELLTTNKHTAEKLKHTLAKFSRTGTLICHKCPKIEVNWQVDPIFACKHNLCGTKLSHKQTLVPCCVLPMYL